MELAQELAKEFAKAINANKKQPKKETIVYGTTVEQGGKMYVKIDGSEQLTPITTTTAVKPDQRVTVMIKNHTATVTGNLTSPSASVEDVDDLNNKISEFEIVMAHSITTDDLNALNANINNIKAITADVQELEAVNAQIESLEAMFAELEYVDATNINAVNAEIEKLEAMFADVTDLSAEELAAVNAEINNLKGYTADFTYVSAEKLEAVQAQINSLEVGNLEATYAKIEDLKAVEADIEELDANKLTANQADLKYASIADLEAVEAAIEDLDVSNLDAKYANIDFSNIGQAAMEYFYAESGLIKDVTVGDQTITGELVGVTIRGDRLIGGTVIADKLVIQGEDGLYYKLNFDGGDFLEGEEVPTDSLHGSVITANSITAEKISVTDLVAFDATIGGFKITEDSIYSGVKESATNTTRGVYLDNTGQMAVGDADNFIKYYKDTDGSYKLAISADEMVLSSSGKTVEDAIDDAVDSANSSTDEKLKNYSTTTQMNSAISQSASNITSTVSQTYSTKTETATAKAEAISTASADATTKANAALSSANTNTANQLKNYSTTAQMNSAISQSASNITSTVSATYTTKEEFSNLEIGGRNLVRSSNNLQDKTCWTYGNSSVTYDTSKSALKISVSGKTANTWTNAANRYLPDKPRSFLNGEKLTLSFEYYIEDVSTFDNSIATELKGIKSGETSAEPVGRVSVGLADLQVGKWVKVSGTFTIASDCDSCYIMPYVTRNGTCWFRKFKLEYGDIATDWTPAPEDTDASIAYQQSGLGMKVNYSAFAAANDGEVYLCAKDPDTNALSAANGWVWWNGVKRTITLGMVNPNAICPYYLTIYMVYRLSSATATTGTLYQVWYNSGWKYAARDATAVVGTWTWVEDTDIVLGSFISPSSEGAIIDAQLFNPPKTSAMVTSATSIGKTAANALSTANTANSKATTNATDITALTTRVTNAESSITQTAEEIRSEVSAELETKKNAVYHTATGDATAAPYRLIATITIKDTYANAPIRIGINQRNKQQSTCYIRFSNANTTDPGLNIFQKSGDSNFYIVKSATSTWQLYVSSAAWDLINVIDYDNPYSISKLAVTWANTIATTLPTTGCVTATQLAGLYGVDATSGGTSGSSSLATSGALYSTKTNLQSSITQNAEEIALKVSKGDVSSQLSVESDQITISGNRFVVDADNLQIDADGTITATGATINGNINANGKVTINNDDLDIVTELKTESRTISYSTHSWDSINNKMTGTSSQVIDAPTFVITNNEYFYIGNVNAGWGQFTNVSSTNISSTTLNAVKGSFSSVKTDGDITTYQGGKITASGELRSTTANGLRIAYGNYGFFIRNDGTNTYFLLTASGDQYGSYNDLRPLTINNSTGKVTCNHSILTNSISTTATSYVKGCLGVGSKTAWNSTVQGWFLGSDGTMHGSRSSTAGAYIGFHWNHSASTTSSIDEAASGVLRLTPSVMIGNNATAIRLIRCGTSVIYGNGTDSQKLMTMATIKTWYSSASQTNTAIFITNGDGDASSMHPQGTCYLGSNDYWYVLYDRTISSSTPFRVNWMVVCWS